MCVVSMIMNHYEPIFPPLTPEPVPTTPVPLDLSPVLDNFIYEGKTIKEWKKLIEEFKAATTAAKLVDKVTGQADCEDPEKMKLVDRVRMLEDRLKQLEERAGV